MILIVEDLFHVLMIIIPEITAKLPYEPYKNHLKKEVEGLLVKKEKGRIIHIKPCAVYRRKRSIGFTLPTVREAHHGKKIANSHRKHTS